MRSPGLADLHGLNQRLAALALLLAPLMLLALGAPVSAEAGSGVAGSERLSNERTYTHWAHPRLEAPIRRLPDRTSRKIARVHFMTEDRFPEVYLVLRRWTDPEARTWLKVRIPMRPHGRKGWVRDSALRRLQLVRTRLVVNRSARRATLYRSGRRIWKARIGIGKPGTPTPKGRFWIRELIKVSDPGGVYGPWAFGTSAYSRLSDWPGGGVIGIHGTDQPHLIPGRPSHGCIRVKNAAIRKLARRMPIGTPVRIR